MWEKIIKVTPINAVMVKSPIGLALWCLRGASKNRIGNSEGLLVEEIHEILRDKLDHPVTEKKIYDALRNAGDKVVRKKTSDGIRYKISKPFGYDYLDSLEGEGGTTNIIYVERGTPRSSKESLDRLLKRTSGKQICVSDPYYGVSSLEIIEKILVEGKRVKFLTRQLGFGEKDAIVRQTYADIQKEFPGKFEMQIESGRDMHDRYIISDAELILIGHGLKDLGGKDSFVVLLDDKTYGGDIRKTAQTIFDSLWKSSIPF